MKKKSSTVEGFVLRRSNGRPDNQRILGQAGAEIGDENITRTIDTENSDKEMDMSRSSISSDIDESLRRIDDSLPMDKKISFRQRRKMAKELRKEKKLKRSKANRRIRMLFKIIIIIMIGLGVYTGLKMLSAGNQMFNGGMWGVWEKKPLQQDENGRSNVLILGTSEDDTGHAGGTLTDSMMIVSVDQNNHNAYMFSIPRDLNVEYGEGCSNGYRGKINAYFSCVNDGIKPADEQDRLAKTQALVGEIFGMDIQYAVHVNYTVFMQSVDAVDGIDVDIQGSNGAKGILDRAFDGLCNYTCYKVKYTNGVHHLNGEQALYLSLARGHEAPTYGLSRSNFDREVNQQKVLIALKDKAVSTGTITNISKITRLIDALGNNLRSNVKTQEIRTILDIAGKIKTTDIHRLDLNADRILDGTGNPTAGEYVYTDIQAYIAKNLSSNPVVREAAPIVVLNGTDQAGFGQTKADILKGLSYNVTIVDNAPEGTYSEVEIYQIGTGNSGTAAKLAKLYGVKIKKSEPPLAVDEDIRFVIVFGQVAAT